ncbi:hypothetical protein [Kutzneria chonburiensis]|uniref:Uncharacterized protein n=1 Tax=Kutzneria chonburiensis TaxID=1483604 RepID=A0ABV6MTA1_9PSEU|nr:hypothetical protein [Kutzneria chonburiensis]
MADFWGFAMVATPVAARTIVALIRDRSRRAGLEQLARDASAGIHIVDRDVAGACLEITVPPR